MRPSRCLFSWFKLLSIMLLAAYTGMAEAQPLLNWDKTLGGESYEELNGQLVLPDGILVGGSTRSNIAFGDPTDFSWSIFIAKLDFDGNVIWRRTYGGAQDERLWALIPTADGGFLAGGYSYSGVSGDKTQPSRGDKDVWLIKINQNGQLLWDKSYGGLYQDEVFSIRPLPAGNGYLLGCHSSSEAGNEKSEPALGLHDFWIIQIDNQGNKVWDKTIGGEGYEQINDIEWAADGNIYLAGGTTSVGGSGDLTPEPTRGGMDFLLIKFNPTTRQIVWTHRYGGAGEDYPYELHILRSGNLLMGGRSGSAPAPPTSFNNGKNAAFYGGDSDYWIIELSPEGQKIREWSFGGDGLDDLYAIEEDETGRLVLGGVSNSGSSGNKTSPTRGGYDYWLVGLNQDHEKTWEMPVGGSSDDALTQLSRLPNGALLISGNSYSNAGFEKTEAAAGFDDFWLVTTLCETTVQIAPVGSLSCSELPPALEVQITDCDSCSILWHNGATTPTINLPNGQTGMASVVVYNEFGCLARDTFVIEPLVPPTIDLGPATVLLLEGNILTLGPADPSLDYQWSSGETSSTIQVTEAGLYAVTITDANQCTATDAVAVEIFVKPKTAIWVPNVFSPNDDGDNDYLPIYADQSVLRIITFQIADRWGSLCFRRDNFLTLRERDGWAGMVGKEVASVGVYTWFAQVEYLDGSRQLLEGNITLLR